MKSGCKGVIIRINYWHFLLHSLNVKSTFSHTNLSLLSLQLEGCNRKKTRLSNHKSNEKKLFSLYILLAQKNRFEKDAIAKCFTTYDNIGKAFLEN